ncbi:hypothetical protein EJ02DRAFT_478575 [Clathrospora elynae]|uniref:Uncharacterized protein n=1 Tax=Clathrospora elynae TaxID=706981 RepID=A0A6A5SEE7_9PLEO|nr:hypothetical protein EJ02DRAFT_478575 [Clathrospora elynae]
MPKPVAGYSPNRILFKFAFVWLIIVSIFLYGSAGETLNRVLVLVSCIVACCTINLRAMDSFNLGEENKALVEDKRKMRREIELFRQRVIALKAEIQKQQEDIDWLKKRVAHMQGRDEDMEQEFGEAGWDFVVHSRDEAHLRV